MRVRGRWRGEPGQLALMLAILLGSLLEGVIAGETVQASLAADPGTSARTVPSRATMGERTGCLECHGDYVPPPGRVGGRDLTVDWRTLANSAHSSLSCVDCHGQFRRVPHLPFATVKVDCERCHPAAAVSLERGVHAAARRRGQAELPSCVACHGGHQVAPWTKGARRLARKLVDLCLDCHTSERMAADYNVPRSAVLVSFQKSTHPLTLATAVPGSLPLCSDCHGAHEARPADQRKQAIGESKFCGRCHDVELTQWQSSVHAAAPAGAEVAGCSQCHGEHRLRLWASANPAAAKTYRACVACHEARQVEVKLALKKSVGVKGGRSYHGTFVRFGRTYVTACESCHGYHDVRPASHPFSRIRQTNMQSTCGRCHEADREQFGRLIVHRTTEPRTVAAAWIVLLDSPWIWAVAVGIATIFGFALTLIYAWVARNTAASQLQLPPRGASE